MLYGVGFGALFAALVWINIPALAALMGGAEGGVTLDLAIQYLRIIIPSLPLLIIGMVGGAILRAHGGDARRAMIATIAAGVVNAVLDPPIFIFGFGLELTGAAMASVASRVAIAFAALYPIYRWYGGLEKPTAAEFRVDFPPAIMTIALPAILTQFATPPLGQAYVTRSMAQFGADAVAGMAIISRLVPVAFGGVIFALSGGAIGPIIGQNFGADRHDRVRGAMRNGWCLHWW